VRCSIRWASSSFAVLAEIAQTIFQLGFDADDGSAELFVRRDEMLGREDQQLVFALDVLAGHQVDDR